MPLKEDDPQMKYVFDYCEKHFSCLMPDDFTGELIVTYSTIADKYMYYYDDIVVTLPKHFNEAEYNKFDILQQQIGNLNLDKQAFWGFIVFLYYSVNIYFKYKTISYSSKIKEINQFIKQSISSDNKLKVTLTSGRKKIEITDSVLITAILSALNSPENYWQDIMVKGLHGEPVIGYTTDPIKLKNLDYAWKEPEKTTERKKSYWVIRLMLQYFFPDSGNVINYPQDISVLCLCVLHLCGFLLGQEHIVCDKDNIITLRKLLTDFDGTTINLRNIETKFGL